MALICEFCTEYRSDGKCGLDLRIPKRMSCREFDPSVERFCSNPRDFIDEAQLVRMAVYFDIKGVELKKIRVVAAREVARRLEATRASVEIRNSEYR